MMTSSLCRGHHFFKYLETSGKLFYPEEGIFRNSIEKGRKAEFWGCTNCLVKNLNVQYVKKKSREMT
jgi:hypothetical protein